MSAAERRMIIQFHQSLTGDWQAQGPMMPTLDLACRPVATSGWAVPHTDLAPKLLYGHPGSRVFGWNQLLQNAPVGRRGPNEARNRPAGVAGVGFGPGRCPHTPARAKARVRAQQALILRSFVWSASGLFQTKLR